MTHSTDAQTAEHHARPRREKSQKKTARNVLLGFAAAVLVIALACGAYVFKLAQTFNTGTTKIENAFPDEATRPIKNVTGAMNILVMGKDKNADKSVDTDDSAPTDQRTDTLIWVHVPADRKNVYAISIMRDTWVNIPGHGEAKINAAMAQGGVALTVQTVESLFQQRIDHVAMVDFEGFKGLTDALGGVEVNIKTGFTPSVLKGKVTFQPGKNLLDGEKALAFVRERRSFPDSDYTRVKNQQLFLKALLSKTISKETLTNPVRINNMVDAMSPYVSVDKDFDAGTIGGLAFQFKDLREKDTIMFTLPNLGVGTSADGQSIVVADQAAISGIANAIGQDKLGAYVTENGLAQ
ncbi:LCP family protein [Paenarthrobacter ureafaciens]|nr:transcriptional regulator [Arthrobacter sp. ZXY-2]